MPKLTKRLIEGLDVQSKDYLLWDEDLSGFGVRIFPSGRKSYLVQYRADGRTRRRAIGQHGALTADEARREARKLLGEVAKGGDPAEDRKRHLEAPTIASLCDRFLADYAAHHCKPSTAKGYEVVIRRCIRPKLGPRKIKGVSRSYIVAFHHDLRHLPYMANRAVSILSKMFNLAEDWGLRSDGTNPARRIQKFKEEEKKRYLSDDEQAALGRVLADALENGEESPFALAAIFLLLLTGCRLSEILTLRWDYVALHHLDLPDSKTGRRRIPLPPEAREILMSLPQIDGNPFVIVGDVEGQHLINLQKTWGRVKGKAGLSDVRMHDLRHTYASVAVMNGVDPFMLKEILGHKSLQTTLRYSHLADHAVQKAAGSVASKLAGTLRRAPNRPDKPTLRLVSGG